MVSLSNTRISEDSLVALMAVAEKTDPPGRCLPTLEPQELPFSIPTTGGRNTSNDVTNLIPSIMRMRLKVSLDETLCFILV